ncbi:MAG: hypothetical protein RLY16_1873 [Bacteroidota bacterium]|jgi:cation diffusion facilitator family transporter
MYELQRQKLVLGSTDRKNNCIFTSQLLSLEKAYQNLRTQKIITAIGILLFIAKLVAWYVTNSVAILTDALESTVNVVAGLVGIYSLYLSSRPRDQNHPYGHGKIEFISAAIEGSLIGFAGLLIIYEAVGHLFHPSQIQKLDIGIILVAITAFINYIAGWYCVKLGIKNNSQVLIAGGKHLKTDTYSTAGIILGLACIYWFKIWWLDSAVAIIFAIIIIYTGYGIIRTSIAGIMDEADEELIKKMVAILQKNRRENWIDFHNLRIIKNGNTLHIDCHLTVPWYFNVHEAHREIDQFSQLVTGEFGTAIELFVHNDGCLEFSCQICNKQNCTKRLHPYQKEVEWTFENVTSNVKHRLPKN